jgi:hypothetical protein
MVPVGALGAMLAKWFGNVSHVAETLNPILVSVSLVFTIVYWWKKSRDKNSEPAE